jgi:hypothetical protein
MKRVDQKSRSKLYLAVADFDLDQFRPCEALYADDDVPSATSENEGVPWRLFITAAGGEGVEPGQPCFVRLGDAQELSAIWQQNALLLLTQSGRNLHDSA